MINTGLLLLCFFFAVQGETFANGQKQTPPNLQSVVENMQSHFNQVKALESKFRQETFSGAVKLKTIAEGDLYIQKPNRMRWDYIKPEKQSFVTDGIKAWLYMPSEKRIVMDNAKSFFQSALVRSFFNGPKDFSKYFSIHLGETKKYKGFVLVLTPKAPDMEVTQITLWVRIEDFQVETIETQDLLGNTNKVILTNICYQESLPEDLFILTIPVGVTLEQNLN